MPDSIKEHHILVNRTARYYALGKLDKQTKTIWFVLHGYGQLAKNFIKSFEDLSDEETSIIAPEALSRFYLNKGYGDIGANWMTKEDRENEIKDYIKYLDELYSQILNLASSKEIKITALGFSQGAATLSRWLTMGKSKVDRAIFWCGELAKEIDYSILRDLDIHLVFADNDQYFPGEFYKTQEKLLDKFGIKYKRNIFNGGHELKVEVIKNILSLPDKICE